MEMLISGTWAGFALSDKYIVVLTLDGMVGKVLEFPPADRNTLMCRGQIGIRVFRAMQCAPRDNIITLKDWLDWLRLKISESALSWWLGWDCDCDGGLLRGREHMQMR